ncbi:MAG: hypothetical protein U0271_13170 [Polyangiaceae bacterium]
MAYLLDTTTLAEVLRAAPSRQFVRRLASVPSKDRWTSVVTVGHLLLAARRAQHARLMQNVVNLVGSVRVAPFDVTAAQTFAKFRATVAADASNDDVMIAAITAAGGFTLVTARTHAFAVFPNLHVEDWIG